MNKINELIKQYFLILFPSPRAWLNFFCIWIFLSVMATSIKESLIVLISAFATLYFLNEWQKQIEVKKFE
jgi:hypothetical protein